MYFLVITHGCGFEIGQHALCLVDPSDVDLFPNM